MESLNKEKLSKKDKIDQYLLIGNPNVGKSTIFNHTTSSVNDVGNFNRTTVSKKRGKIKNCPNKYLIDLPGVYNLKSTFADECIAIDTVLANKYNGIVNVLNSTTFKRDMHLTIQLLETGKDIFINLNMVDELNQRKIDKLQLKKQLRCNVNLTIANKNVGIKNIKNELNCPIKGFRLNYGPEIEAEIRTIMDKITIDCFSKRFIAIQLLEGNDNVLKYLRENGQDLLVFDDILKAKEKYSLGIIDRRNQFINKVYLNSFIFEEGIIYKQSTLAKKIDFILLKQSFGIPIFILSLMGVYYITFGPYTGGYVQSKIDYFLNDYLSDEIKSWFAPIADSQTWWWVPSIICDGFIAGVFGVLPFFIYIIILFFFVGLFQQSGFIARISVICDRLLYKVGLSGRSIIALISGMGCNVPTIMMARGSASRREKLTSIFIAPFISCSARATVFAFIASMVITNNTWIVIFSLQIISAIIALAIGLIFSQTMFRKSPYLLVQEIPKWRRPDPKSISKLMWFECKTFFHRVVIFIVIGSIFLWFLVHLGPTGLLNDDQISTSFIVYFSKYLSYIFIPLGLNDYRIVTSLILAIPAKELAISNMLIIFKDQASIQEYFTFARALSYLIFFMLYIPCISTLAIFKKETSWKFTIVNVSASLSIAWILSTIIYQTTILI
ncbi:ferrous iron transport protein B [Spiroplasma endosymbiont of Aspidapion aeneum]|uniref:ferrous iron transport protein B n=1 Tax=Spiroplasma endosymbiont of Aspidapion aeneum TaxID=3066276 RepID=UPI00313C6F52